MNNLESNELVNFILEKLTNKGLDINDILSERKGLSFIVENIIDALLEAQRDDFLIQTNDSRNGYYSRSLNTSLAKLNLHVPRTRNEKFFPPMLEKYNRSDDSYFKLVANLLINGRSKEHIKTILSDFKLNFSPKVAEIVFKQISQQVRDFKSAQLPEEMPFVYIDAYHCKVKDIQSNEDNSNGIVKESAIYTVIGINFEAKKQVLGYYVTFGNENKGTWIKIFNDLVKRKLSRVMMFITDDFTGITEAIKSVYPYALTQKCLVHFFRNCHKNLPSSVASDFVAKLKNIRDDSSVSFEEAVNKFENICNAYRNYNETFIDYIIKKKQEYWQFMKFDVKIRKYINNTNVVENFNSVLERIRISLGGYFQSIDVAEKSVFLAVNRLHNNVWDKPNPRLKHAEHDIRQKFNLTFVIYDYIRV